VLTSGFAGAYVTCAYSREKDVMIALLDVEVLTGNDHLEPVTFFSRRQKISAKRPRVLDHTVGCPWTNIQSKCIVSAGAEAAPGR
jgi:hypothetical protein